MGCFAFTFADNGNNIVRGPGWIYITEELSKKLKIKSPIRFSDVDCYGVFECKIGSAVMQLDIYALYALDVYVSRFKTQDMKKNGYFYDGLIDEINKRNKADYKNLDALMDIIRSDGIHILHKHLHSTPSKKVCVLPLARQKEKTVMVKEKFDGQIPLFITKKKIGTYEYSIDAAREWGFVSSLDPNQGFSITRNEYALWTYGTTRIPK